MLKGLALWGLGYADQGQQRGQDALTQAQQTGPPLSLDAAKLIFFHQEYG
jgi:hypothetical protein